jgi:hypothetical protein
LKVDNLYLFTFILVVTLRDVVMKQTSWNVFLIPAALVLAVLKDPILSHNEKNVGSEPPFLKLCPDISNNSDARDIYTILSCFRDVLDQIEQLATENNIELAMFCRDGFEYVRLYLIPQADHTYIEKAWRIEPIC